MSLLLFEALSMQGFIENVSVGEGEKTCFPGCAYTVTSSSTVYLRWAVRGEQGNGALHCWQ